MKKPFRIVFVLLFPLPALTAQQLDQVLAAVQENVQRLETSAPDFICDEQIVSRLYQGDKVKRTTTAIALLTTTHTAAKFSESRSSMKINGKPTKRNAIDGPFVWQGGSAYADLHLLFNSQHGRDCLTRELKGVTVFQARKALLMSAGPAEGFTRHSNCENVRPSASDTIWIDAEAANVLRIESYNRLRPSYKAQI